VVLIFGNSGLDCADVGGEEVDVHHVVQLLVLEDARELGVFAFCYYHVSCEQQV
jgi:hypothetical protein